VVTGAVLAHELDTEFDVELTRKLKRPGEPTLSVGAIAETGHIFVDPHEYHVPGLSNGYLAAERRHLLSELAKHQQQIRDIRVQACIEGRSVIVTDDGIMSGSTMTAALQAVQPQHPSELIVAVPVAPADRLKEIRAWCDDVICLLTPEGTWTIDQFYEDFGPVGDDVVNRLLRDGQLSHHSIDAKEL